MDSWQVILEKFKVKVNNWTHHCLSFTGQVQLLQSVVQALPLYRGMIQVAPVSFVKSLDSLARHFLWAGNLSSTKWSLIKWEIVCSPKRFGGLGLRQSFLSGTALVAKLYWRWCVE